MLLLPFQEEKEGDATKDSLDDLFPNEEEEDPSNGCESASGAGGWRGAAGGWSQPWPPCTQDAHHSEISSPLALEMGRAWVSTLISSASPLFVNIYETLNMFQAPC